MPDTRAASGWMEKRVADWPTNWSWHLHSFFCEKFGHEKWDSYIYITCCINLNHWKVGQCQQMARRLKPGWFGYRTSRSPLRWDSSRQPKSSHQHLQRIAWILGDPVKVIGILFWGALVGFVCLKIDTIRDPQENRQVHSTQLVFWCV